MNETPVPEAVTAALASLSEPSNAGLWAAAAEDTAGGLLARKELVIRALLAAGPVITAAERERIRQRSIERIAGYVLANRNGEAVGVTEFVNDLIGAPDVR